MLKRNVCVMLSGILLSCSHVTVPVNCQRPNILVCLTLGQEEVICEYTDEKVAEEIDPSSLKGLKEEGVFMSQKDYKKLKLYMSKADTPECRDNI